MDSPVIIMIADYGIGDPAFTEVALQLTKRIPRVTILPQSTPPFSTLNTGFWIYQLGVVDGLKDTFIFSNTAPRFEDDAAQKNNKGEKFAYAKLKNGVEIMAVYAGYTFSFIKPYIETFHLVNVSNEGSQFRSRDNFPEAVARMVAKDVTVIGEKIAAENILDVPQQKIGSVDGYGNIKTTTTLSKCSYDPGQKLSITLNNKTIEATFTDGIFNIPQGEVAFAPGSSGHSDRFMEIFYRGKSAWELFGKPAVESSFTISLA
jgi:S-adenosylmethionine hydrolase